MIRLACLISSVKLRIDVISVFPDYLKPLGLSLIGKAQEKGLLTIGVHDLRDWARDKHRTVDDTPYGGGAGMVMRPDVWGAAIDDILQLDPQPGFPAQRPSDSGIAGLTRNLPPDSGAAAVAQATLIFPTPAGKVFTQQDADQLALADHLVFACGRYEGIDARVARHYAESTNVVVREYSIGDYVLNGGEVAALAMIEAITRLIPGFMGNPDSLVEESHGSQGLLEYPIFTKPPQWRGQAVPEVLLTGNHKKIADWRYEQSLALTESRRPDLLRDHS